MDAPASQAGDAVMTLAQIEAMALANQPRLLAAQLRSRASQQRIRENRSALYPSVAFNATGVRVADTGTATAAGAITTSSISDRFSPYGGNLVQMVADFGRTSALIGASRSQAEAQNEEAVLTGAQVRLNVRQTYFQVMGAEAVLRAAREAQSNRETISKQIGALAESQVRSTLDVNFANVLQSVKLELAGGCVLESTVRATAFPARDRSWPDTADYSDPRRGDAAAATAARRDHLSRASSGATRRLECSSLAPACRCSICGSREAAELPDPQHCRSGRSDSVSRRHLA